MEPQPSDGELLQGGLSLAVRHYHRSLYHIMLIIPNLQHHARQKEVHNPGWEGATKSCHLIKKPCCRLSLVLKNL
jgi:hypothetical protein